VPFAVCPESDVMVPCGKAECQCVAALLRLSRLWYNGFISQTPQRLSPRSQRVGTVV
jgi:hypothetical protein